MKTVEKFLDTVLQETKMSRKKGQSRGSKESEHTAAVQGCGQALPAPTKLGAEPGGRARGHSGAHGPFMHSAPHFESSASEPQLCSPEEKF